MTEPLQFHKTRIAPTPSGYLHLGNALSFALTAALSKNTGAKILLRIDDLDRDRVQPAYVQDIFDTLDFLEIPYDEGPRNMKEYEQDWPQVHRMDMYRKALDQLREDRSVFACTCSRSQVQGHAAYPGNCYAKPISLDEVGACWRFRTDPSAEWSVRTFNGVINEPLPADVQDFIVRKKDGYPAYQLTSICDDQFFSVDLIVRGQDLWPSTLAQIELASRLKLEAYTNSTFYHHPLLSATNGMKLSKSAGDTSIKYLRSTGQKPAEIYSAIAANLGFKEPVKDYEALGKLLLL
jgi:glutamyl/glutaminyl-tRNA synthetase